MHHFPKERSPSALATHGPGRQSQTREEASDAEGRWKRTVPVVDERILRDAAQELRVPIHAAKVTFLKTQIAENSDRMSLYRIVDTFLLKKPIH
jgi:hypothetical protein